MRIRNYSIRDVMKGEDYEISPQACHYRLSGPKDVPDKVRIFILADKISYDSKEIEMNDIGLYPGYGIDGKCYEKHIVDEFENN